MQQQPVRGDQHHFEKHEQIEQVAGQEGAVQSHELQLQQRVKMRASPVLAVARRGQRDQSEQAGQGDHQGGETISQQHDAPGRGPVAQQVDPSPAIGGQRQQPCRAGCGQRSRDPGKHPLRRDPPVKQHQRSRQRRQDDRNDRCVSHGDFGPSSGSTSADAGSCFALPTRVFSPSTWSLPLSAWVRRASTSNSAVMANPITIAVSTRA